MTPWPAPGAARDRLGRGVRVQHGRRRPDGDGDIDVVLGEHKLERRVLVFENLGAGASWRQHLADGDPGPYDHHAGTQLVDPLGNGVLAIASVGWNHVDVLLYTRTPTHQIWLPQIAFWPGLELAYGAYGRPQDRVTVLGRVSGDGLGGLSYTLNGGRAGPWPCPLARTAGAGDFALELDLAISPWATTWWRSPPKARWRHGVRGAHGTPEPAGGPAAPLRDDLGWRARALGARGRRPLGVVGGWLQPAATASSAAWHWRRGLMSTGLRPRHLGPLGAPGAGVGLGVHWQGYGPTAGSPPGEALGRWAGTGRREGGVARLEILDAAGGCCGPGASRSPKGCNMLTCASGGRRRSVYSLKAWLAGGAEPAAWDVTGFGPYAGPGRSVRDTGRRRAWATCACARPLVGPPSPRRTPGRAPPGDGDLRTDAGGRLLLGRAGRTTCRGSARRSGYVSTGDCLRIGAGTTYARAVVVDGSGEGYSTIWSLPRVRRAHRSSRTILRRRAEPDALGARRPARRRGARVRGRRHRGRAAPPDGGPRRPRDGAAGNGAARHAAGARHMVLEAKPDAAYRRRRRRECWSSRIRRRTCGSACAARRALYAWAGRLIGGTVSTWDGSDHRCRRAPLPARGPQGNTWKQWYARGANGT